MTQSACFFAEQLSRCPGAGDQEAILFARCYYQASEFRRSLAVLETNGLMSSDGLQIITNSFCDKNVILDESQLNKLSAILLCSQCFFALGKYEECIGLLEPFLPLDYDEDDDSFEALKNVRTLNSSLSINVFAGMFSLLLLVFIPNS